MSKGRKERHREYYARNRDKITARMRARNAARKAENPEAWLARARRDKGMPAPTRPMPAHCESCGREETRRGKKLALDHDHATGAFRGWLCHNCNLALGLLADSLAYIARLSDYLTKAK